MVCSTDLFFRWDICTFVLHWKFHHAKSTCVLLAMGVMRNWSLWNYPFPLSSVANDGYLLVRVFFVAISTCAGCIAICFYFWWWWWWLKLKFQHVSNSANLLVVSHPLQTSHFLFTRGCLWVFVSTKVAMNLHHVWSISSTREVKYVAQHRLAATKLR